ncbi:FtsW/RodA/SpoVE family cell cycle protein [Angustibacter luteus]|uniref:peptidoglycan glycosyltransferase n=1 Tax=Angustibacter luteus TaxID=658456 RepID=A0ABW1JEB5_9ACTN
MATITTVVPRTRRGVELVLLVFAVGIVLVAYANVGLAVDGELPPSMVSYGVGLIVLVGAVHLMLRWKASYADPVMLPIATLLNGLGLVMIHRLDLAEDRSGGGMAARQLIWMTIGVAICLAILYVIRDHRMLQRYTFTAMLVGLGLLLLPLVPGLGKNINGSRIWIGVGSLSFQPGELAKILLAIFFAGYLVQTRDSLALVGRKVLGISFPRARDLGPIIVAWLASLAVLIFERDLGSSLLFFGLFVAMLYVATERKSWIFIGFVLFVAGSYLAYLMFGHVQRRVLLWLHPFSQKALEVSDQLVRGLFGMADGGLLGTGLGRGHPDLTYYAESDFIVPSFGEEIGLVGVFALLLLYLIFVERGLRTALGVRDGYGKLLASGLAFTVALQCFVVVGGVTRVIPLTGLTMPFLSAGGSSLVANWAILGLLLRISDQARRPAPAIEPTNLGLDDAPTEVVKLR